VLLDIVNQSSAFHYPARIGTSLSETVVT